MSIELKKKFFLHFMCSERILSSMLANPFVFIHDSRCSRSVAMGAMGNAKLPPNSFATFTKLNDGCVELLPHIPNENDDEVGTFELDPQKIVGFVGVGQDRIVFCAVENIDLESVDSTDFFATTTIITPKD